MKIEEIKKETTKILNDVLKVANKHNIKVYPLYGTLLGIKRHGGFIPWDDDIDVAVFEEDLEKLIIILKKELDSSYVVGPFLYPEGCSTGRGVSKRVNGVNINLDIFMISYVKNIKKNPKKLFYSIAKRYVRLSKGGGLQKFARVLLSVRSKKHYDKRMNKLKDKYTTKENTGMCVVFIDDERYMFNSNIFKETKPIVFEGIKWYVTKHPEEFLEKTYGDWKKIPSDKQKRKAQHYDF